MQDNKKKSNSRVVTILITVFGLISIFSSLMESFHKAAEDNTRPTEEGVAILRNISVSKLNDSENQMDQSSIYQVSAKAINPESFSRGSFNFSMRFYEGDGMSPIQVIENNLDDTSVDTYIEGLYDTVENPYEENPFLYCLEEVLPPGAEYEVVYKIAVNENAKELRVVYYDSQYNEKTASFDLTEIQ